jgi:hypothetical protein
MLTYDGCGRDHALTLLGREPGGEVVIHGRRFDIVHAEPGEGRF